MTKLRRAGAISLRSALLLLGAVLIGCTSTPAGSGAAASGRSVGIPSGRTGSAGATTASGSSAPTDGAGTSPATGAARRRLPAPRHVVVVMEENHSYSDIIGNGHAPYINALAHSGASFTHSYAVTHPSEPNYLALFSGSTHGLTSDSCPHTFGGTNLGYQLRSHGLSFAGYSERLPRTGYLGCVSGRYARKHVPWTDFRHLPGSVNKPFTAFPTHYSALPRLSFVIPDLEHDMHNGTIHQGDAWLKSHLAGYVAWARANDSLLVLTWDEDDGSVPNHIPTIVVGAHVHAGRYRERVTHYRLLRTLEALERLPAIGHAARFSPIRDIWTG